MITREQLQQEIRAETRQFAIWAVIVLVAALGVGIALGRFVLFHS